MTETVISIILFFNVALVILYFILRIHRHMVDRAREDYTGTTGTEEKNNIPPE